MIGTIVNVFDASRIRLNLPVVKWGRIMKKYISYFMSLVILFGTIIQMDGRYVYADSTIDLTGNLVFTANENIDNSDLYEDIQLIDNTGKKIDVLLNKINDKQVIITPLFDMSNISAKVLTKYKKYSIENYEKQAYVGSKKNLEKLAKLSESMGYSGGGLLMRTKESVVQAPAGSSMEKKSDINHSNTNTQVKGIDEGDKVKTDGEYIYFLKDSSIVIVKAQKKGQMELMSEIRYDNNSLYPQTMYIDKDKLIVIGSGSNKRGDVTKSVIYDLTDKKNPKSVRVIEQDGYYFDSRKKGTELHVLTSSYLYGAAPILPLYRDEITGESQKEVLAEKIMIFPGCYSSSLVTISSIDVNKSEEAKITSFMGNQDNVYMSENNLYLSYRQFKYYPLMRQVQLTTKLTPNVMPEIYPSYERDTTKTTIKKFSVNGTQIDYKAEAEINGWILNQFSMDEKDGYFRVAYTTDDMDYKRGSSLSIFDSEMKRVGSVENIAPGEKIHSVRFMGNKAYMVTFKNIDPFFVLDLKNPTSPKILGYLKIPGVSEYLHPYDENTIIGFGKDTINNKKDTAFYLGMKISLFDVTDVNNPIEKYVEKIGDRGTESEILNDHKALLYDGKRGIMGFPITVTQVKGAKMNDEFGFPNYGDPIFQGAYLYDVTKDQLKIKGKITHIKNFDPYNYSYDNQITRMIYIGDTVYTLSNNMIMATDMNSMKTLATLSIKK